MLHLIPWLLLAIPGPAQDDPLAGMDDAPAPTTEDWIVSGHWTPTLRPDSRGYLGTSSGPVLGLGHARLSLEHRRTELDGLRDGTRGVSTASLIGSGYARVPTSGSIDRTELRAEYGLGDATSLRLTIPIESRSMRFDDGGGGITREKAHGLADVELGTGVELSHKDGERAEIELMVAVPTGTIRAREGNSSGPAQPLLPYAMQLGGGTYALKPGFTWTHWSSHWSFGTALQATIPMGENDQGWSRGDQMELSSWISRRIDPFRSLVVGMQYRQEDSIQGQDPNMDPTADPSFDPGFIGSKRLSLDLGLHMIVERNNRLALEIGVPVWQDTDGPQVEEQYHFAVAWWLSF
ncbi:MAG: transporter [Planctomycetota bacterium]|nr:transporter [Planctomycetota bacterium]